MLSFFIRFMGNEIMSSCLMLLWNMRKYIEVKGKIPEDLAYLKLDVFFAYFCQLARDMMMVLQVQCTIVEGWINKGGQSDIY